jgi:hypothetical protein
MCAARRKLLPATSFRIVSRVDPDSRRSGIAPIAALPAVMRIVLCEDENDGKYHGITEIWNFTKVLV